MPSTHRLAHRAVVAKGLWGPDVVRVAGASDVIDGASPELVLEPTSAEMLSAILRWANVDGVRLMIRGGGTKLARGSVPSRVDAVVSMARLNTAIEHYAGDLTASIAAGMPLGTANTVLRRNQQWLPLDAPDAERATIGGLVATNDSGPRRHRFGTPRDLIIGVEIALADGRLAKGGGRVVKNVAGYDLARLMCGSFGTLGVIVNAIFKLSPIPETSRTVVADVDRAGDIAPIVAALSASSLVASALELSFPPARVLIRFETVTSAAEQQAAAAAALCRQHGARTDIVRDVEESDAWDAHAMKSWAEPATLVRVSVLPTECGHALGAIESLAGAGGICSRVIGRAAMGVLVLQLAGTLYARVAAIAELRRVLTPKGGHVVVIAAEPALRARIDPWGQAPAAIATMRALKQQFDPNHILNAGRGPGGL